MDIKKRKIIISLVLIILAIVTNMSVFKSYRPVNDDVVLSYKLKSDKEDTYQVFYGTDLLWSEDKSQSVDYTEANKEQEMKFIIPKDTTKLRVDFGTKDADISISDMNLSYGSQKNKLSLKKVLNNSNQLDIKKIENDDYADIDLVGEDSYVVYNLEADTISKIITLQSKQNNTFKFGLCILIDIIILLLIKKSGEISALITELKNNKWLIWNLSKNDFKTKYAGSYLGIVWAFIQPIVTTLLYWFVFEFGLKAGSPVNDVPFILWIMGGLVPWFFFQEALMNATNCMMEYSYLVKKVVFKISILPIVKIISSLFVHLVFMIFLLFVAQIYGFYVSEYTFQFIYYLICMFVLVLGISYATSAIVIFFKDLGQIINILLQVGMWGTPIMWSYSMLPEKYQWILNLNPIYYIAEGYRDTFINKIWFFEKIPQTLCFWIITLILFTVGIGIFRKLKPHFADVL
ncbi:ABC transporter permease [Clostridium neonatale]|uniref:ABC transporter permease n=1 Tax=Clostridium neonatale TaxID=137838 RepID=UPI00291B56A4|nr:ABC transporter permease [Clostridium neonatale]CAI3593514.1 lipopolysaccharide transport system permease protein [Clostridium neonatale]